MLTPLMGQIKGAAGPDFVIPCVDFELDITLQQTARSATADCWNPTATAASASAHDAGGRWMIGAGAEPATPPSVKWSDQILAVSFFVSLGC